MGLRTTRTPLRLAMLTAAVSAALLAGCSSVKLDETPVESRTPTATPGATAGGAAGSTAAGSTAATAPQSRVATVDLNSGAAAGAAGAAAAAASLGRIVYFDFDSFVVKDDFRPLLEGHAKALGANKARRMLIEGHTDERGGREYNLALGQKRAEAVAKTMALLGVGEGQLEAVSYGKERPVDDGHDEAAWAKNRRAELKDR
ncbi:MAG: peptidoglycan-associated lipoprotein Pal [Burkholderiaceae bacterium]|nr:peptidoglycan-associated lipoprotein Pal [Burkholderiaceae bacterium]